MQRSKQEAEECLTLAILRVSIVLATIATWMIVTLLAPFPFTPLALLGIVWCWGMAWMACALTIATLVDAFEEHGADFGVRKVLDAYRAPRPRYLSGSSTLYRKAQPSPWPLRLCTLVGCAIGLVVAPYAVSDEPTGMRQLTIGIFIFLLYAIFFTLVAWGGWMRWNDRPRALRRQGETRFPVRRTTWTPNPSTRSSGSARAPSSPPPSRRSAC